jgi:hypothetical protein
MRGGTAGPTAAAEGISLKYRGAPFTEILQREGALRTPGADAARRWRLKNSLDRSCAGYHCFK